jgi:hypothetical protein
MRKLGLDDLLEPPIVAAIWVLFAWLWAQGVNRAAKLNHLTALQKLGIVFGALFFLGMAYIVNVAQALRLPESNCVLLVVTWTALLGGTGYWRHSRKRLRKNNEDGNGI